MAKNREAKEVESFDHPEDQETNHTTDPFDEDNDIDGDDQAEDEDEDEDENE
ncbi:MAG: hypothetical protein ACRD3J_18595 [Thermoanaerobaculia bacterium]